MSEELPEKRRRGRPKGSSNISIKRKTNLEELVQTITVLAEKVSELEVTTQETLAKNEALSKGYLNNPINLPKVDGVQKKEWTPQELTAIAEGKAEVPSNSPFELEAMEYRRSVVSKMVLRGVPRMEIATFLGVSLDTVRADIIYIRKKWQEAVCTYDLNFAIGETLAFYREVRDLNMGIASTVQAEGRFGSTRDRVAASHAAMAAEAGKNEFLSKLGLYKLADPKDTFPIGQDDDGMGADTKDLTNFVNLITQYEIQDADFESIPNNPSE